MNTSSEINALLSLIDDPDEEVFENVTQRFIGFGNEVIPFLEDYRISSTQIELAKRAEYIIQRISLKGLEHSLREWVLGEENSMLEAAMAIAGYLDREYDREHFIFEVEKFRKSIWLELNSYLTPLEEINIFNRILFGYFKLKGVETDHTNKDDFDIVQLFQQKKSNTFPLGALYLILAEMLGISLKPVDIPRQNLLAYLDASNPFGTEEQEQIIFYVDPFNGQVYTHKDVENYLKKIDYTPHPISITSSTHRKYVQKWLLEIGKCAKKKGDTANQDALNELAYGLDDL